MTWLSDNHWEEGPPAMPIAMSIRDVGYWRAPPKHARPRRARNEALNRLLEFAALARTLPVAGDPALSETTPPVIQYLRHVSLDIPRGAAVCVVDIGGASRNAFLRIASRLEAPRTGIIEYHGSVLGLDQLGAMPYAFESVQRNLRRLADALQLSETSIAETMAAIRSIPDLAGFLDLPAYRVPKWARVDIALGAACCLQADIVVISNLRLPGGALKELWEGFVKRASARGTTLLMTGRNLATVLPWATHVMLLDDGALKAFGPSRVIAADHADFLAVALRTPVREDWLSISDTGAAADEQDGDDPDDDAMAASMAPGTVFLDGDDVSEEEGGAEGLEGQRSFRLPIASFIRIAQDGAEDKLDADPRASDRSERSAWSWDQRLFDVERELHIEFGLQVFSAPVRIQPCLDLWWKETVHVVRAPGPVLTAAASRTFSGTVTIPESYLTRAPWSVGILLRTWDRDGNFREFLADKQSIYPAREKGATSATVAAKLKGILGPALEICRLKTVPAAAGQPAASISITPAGSSEAGPIRPLAPVDVHAKWAIADGISSSPIRLDIVHHGRVLTGTPEQVIPLPPGHVLLVHARIPKNLLASGRYLVRVTRNPPGPDPRDKRPIVLVAAEFSVSAPEGPSADENHESAAARSVDDPALHAEFLWDIAGADPQSTLVPAAAIEP